MSRTILVLLILGTVAALQASADVKRVGTSKKVTLQQAGAFDEEKMVEVKLGQKLDAVLKLRIDDFFDKRCVYVTGKVKNPTDTPIYYQLYVAFYDRSHKLVCCAGEASFGSAGIKAGKEDDVNQCIMAVPHAAAAQIGSYDIVLWEGTKTVGEE